jgi:hypothetical protein
LARAPTLLKRGADLVEVMTADGMLDTITTQGMLVIVGIQVGLGPNFHCFAPVKVTSSSGVGAVGSVNYSDVTCVVNG